MCIGSNISYRSPWLLRICIGPEIRHRSVPIRYFKTFTQLLFIWETYFRNEFWTLVTALNVIEHSSICGYFIHNPVRPPYTLQHNMVYCISAIFTSRLISAINHRHLFHFWFSMVLFFLKKAIQKNVCTIVCVYWYKKHNYKRYIRVKNQTLWGDRGALSKVLYVAANIAVSQSSVQLGLQDLSPRLDVQRRHLPADQLVRWPHVAVTSSQPVSLQPAASVVPHQGDLHAANTAEVLKHLKPSSQSVQQPLRVPSNTSDL